MLTGPTLATGTAAAPAPAKKKRAKPKASLTAAQVDYLARYITVAAGVVIPLLALTLSHCAGKLAGSGHYLLAAWALALCGAVLSVSLPHLSWAIEDITRSTPRASIALAGAVDMTLVLCEAVAIATDGAVSPWLVYGTMAAVTAMSMVLNVWAFLRHPQPKAKK